MTLTRRTFLIAAEAEHALDALHTQQPTDILVILAFGRLLGARERRSEGVGGRRGRRGNERGQGLEGHGGICGRGARRWCR